MKNIKKQEGFTLIELLVVIAIISILSAIVITSLDGARARAEDSKIVQQVTQFQQAVNLFYANEGKYPYPNTTNYVCIAPEGETCYFFNAEYTAPSLSGTDFAMFENSFNDLALKGLESAEAQSKVVDYIKFQSFSLPVVTVSGAQYGGGILYRCSSYSGGECNYGEVIFATNNPVDKGTRTSYSTDFTVYRQDAAQPDAGEKGFAAGASY